MMPSGWRRPPDATASTGRHGRNRKREPQAPRPAARGTGRRPRGQERLDRIVQLIADSMRTEVCSIYLFRDTETLELCATEGLKAGRRAPDADAARRGAGGPRRPHRPADQHRQRPGGARLPLHARDGRGDVSRASSACRSSGWASGSACWSCSPRKRANFTDDEVYALEVVAMVLAEMAELGAFVGEGAALKARHQQPVMFRGTVGQEGTAEGRVWLHEPRVVVTNPIADDPAHECERLREAVDQLRISVDDMLDARATRSTRSTAGARGLPDVRQFARLAAPDGGGHRARPLGRGGGREGAVGGARAAAARCPTPTCASGCTTSTTCRTGFCASSPARAARPAPRCPTTRSSSPATSGPGELLDYGRSLQGHRAGGGLGRQPCRHRRPRAGDPAGDPRRAASPPRR